MPITLDCSIEYVKYPTLYLPHKRCSKSGSDDGDDDGEKNEYDDGDGDDDEDSDEDGDEDVNNGEIIFMIGSGCCGRNPSTKRNITRRSLSLC